MQLKVVNNEFRYSLYDVPDDVDAFGIFKSIICENIQKSDYPVSCSEDTVAGGGLFSKTHDPALIIRPVKKDFIIAITYSTMGTTAIFRRLTSCPIVNMQKGKKQERNLMLIDFIESIIDNSYKQLCE